MLWSRYHTQGCVGMNGFRKSGVIPANPMLLTALRLSRGHFRHRPGPALEPGIAVGAVLLQPVGVNEARIAVLRVREQV